MRLLLFGRSLTEVIAIFFSFMFHPPALLLAADRFNDPALNLKVVESCAYTEIATNESPHTIEGAIGYQGYVNDCFAFHSGFAFQASELMDKFFGGVQAGLRIGLGRGFTPFIGVGAFIGYTEKEVVDEKQTSGAVTVSTGGADGKSNVISDTIATVYPEAGLSIPIGQGFRLTVSARRHFISKGSEYDFWSFCLGMAFHIP